MLKIGLVVFLCIANFKTELPELNTKIMDYLEEVVGKKVARGECWDLAAGALAYSGAYFDRSSMKTVTIYGRSVNPEEEQIYPGDLMQFENVSLEWREGNKSYSSSMGQHTAIVYQVNDTGNYEIAHQNTSQWGRKVGVSNFQLDRVTKGDIFFYRPIIEKE